MRKQVITSAAVRNLVPSHALATRAGPFLFLSGQMGIDDATGRPYRTYRELGGEPPYPALGLLAPNTWEEAAVTQTWAAYDRIGRLLEEQGASREALLFHSIYMRDIRDFPTLVRTRSKLFAGGLVPPVTTGQIPGLLLPDARVCFDPIGFVADGEGGGPVMEMMESRYLAQSALSNYRFGSRVGPLMFFAGVVGAVPDQGVIIHDARYLAPDVPWTAPAGSYAARMVEEPVAAQASFIYDLFRRFLEEKGAGLENLLKANVYLRQMRDIGTVEAVAERVATRSMPATTVYGVESLATRHFLIEIEGIALQPGAGWEQKTVYAIEDGDLPVRPYGRHALGTRAGELVFVSGMIAFDGSRERVVSGPADLPDAGRKIVEQLLAGEPGFARSATAPIAAAQAWLALEQIARVLSELDSSMASVLKLTIYLRDMADFEAVEAVSASLFPQDPPALTVLQPSALPLATARVEIDAIAVADQ